VVDSTILDEMRGDSVQPSNDIKDEYRETDKAGLSKITDQSASLRPWKWVLLEWGIIFISVWLFCSGILDLGENTRLPGNEAEIFQSLDWTLVNSIKQYGNFPLWNPYLQTGLPYVADPMLHAFNPISTVPVLLFGVRDGFKLAVALSFLIAAFGAWRLGFVLGMNRPARVWVALTFAFAGQPVARFFQGQYLFILGFAWIPWAVSYLFQVAETRRKRDMALAVLSLALIFFSGNAYYALYMLFVVVIFSFVTLFHFQRRKPFLQLDRQLFIRLLVIGILTLGVITVQLLPQVDFWPHVSKSTEVVGAHSLYQIFLDFTSKDTTRPDAYSQLPAREEFYAYIGIAPFLGLSLLPIAFWKRKRRSLLFFIFILLLMVFWIDPGLFPWYNTIIQPRILLQFRHLLRILIFGSLALIFLAGLGLDTLWKTFTVDSSNSTTSAWHKVRAYTGQAGKAALMLFMFLAVVDLYQTHHGYIKTQTIPTAPYAAMEWLRGVDPTEYYVRLNPNNAYPDAPLSAGLRFIDAWYHFGDMRNTKDSTNIRPLQARPNYVVQHKDNPAPELPGNSLMNTIEDYHIYQAPNSLPYVFSVSNDVLSTTTESGELQRADVFEQASFSPGPNTVEVITNAENAQTLVMLTTYYPGWVVEADGREQRIKNVSGYLAVDLLPGDHKYTFSFRSTSFYIGFVISLIVTSMTFYLLLSDLKLALIRTRQAMLSAPKTMKERLGEIKNRFSTDRIVTQGSYQSGVLVPKQPLNLEENTAVHLTIERGAIKELSPRVYLRHWLWSSIDLLGSIVRSIPFEAVLFTAALGIYLFTRLWEIDRFPIYFFGDEAVQTLFAEDLITRKFLGPDGSLLPIYIEAAALRWTPLLSMYFHAISLTLFGKSITITRATSLLVSILGAASIGLSLKNVFKARYWWAGVLLLSITPAWFLHSRTAFETVMTTAFYACFLYAYLLYRIRSPHYLYAAILFGGATFYTYSNAQAIILAAAGLLFLSDLRFHLQHPRILVRGVLLAALIAIPLINFRLSHPQAISEHLRMVGSYWYQDITIWEKVRIFIQKFVYGLSPQYWFIPNEHDLARHRMAGIGHIHITILPFAVIGLALTLRKWRSSARRAILIAALATPVGAALVDIGIARVLAFVIPANLLAGLGIDWVLERLKDRIPYRILATGLFLALSLTNFSLLRTALKDGPSWFNDYGLYGMQYGAKQLFVDAIPDYLRESPENKVLVSSTWANGTDNFIRFFLTQEEQKRVRMDGVGTYLFKQMPLSRNDIFIMTPAEYEQALESPKFRDVSVDQIVPYPDGSPGFYFARLEYAEDVETIFAAEKEARRQLISDQVTINGQQVNIRYSQTDMGIPQHAFDDDLFTLMRGLEANPFILEIEFPNPRPVTGLVAEFGHVNLQVTARLYPRLDANPTSYEGTFLNSTGNVPVQMDFNLGPEQVTKIRFEFLNLQSGETANIHVREINLLP